MNDAKCPHCGGKIELRVTIHSPTIKPACMSPKWEERLKAKLHHDIESYVISVEESTYDKAVLIVKVAWVGDSALWTLLMNGITELGGHWIPNAAESHFNVPKESLK